jgi:ornithine carbamoyltransferase
MTKMTDEKKKELEEMLLKSKSSVKGRPDKSLLSLFDLSEKEVDEILELGIKIKQDPQKYSGSLKGKSVALIFQKTSTRTRCSFEIGVGEMGGQPMYIDWRTSNFTLSDLKDEIKVLSRYVDLIMARVYKHIDLETMKEHSEVPIINGLCDKEHPCQILADLMTIKEYFGRLNGIKIAYVGDGNNVCNSLIVGAAKAGMKIAVACPKQYLPDKAIVAFGEHKGALEMGTDPKAAVKDADVVYTDTWVSMGEEEKAEEKIAALKGYQVNKELLECASAHALVMHCLPAHIGYEITDEALHWGNSVIFDQAENRKHAQKALMLKMMGVI